jgi:hypothetical protein
MENINELLDKYWNADLSPEEEKQIKEYFASGQVSLEHNQYKEYFNYLTQQASLRSDFNPLAKVEEVMKRSSQEVVGESTAIKEVKIFTFTKRWQAAAAMMVFSLLCMWGVSLYLNQMNKAGVAATAVKKARIIEIDDPEEAMQYTEDAMNLIASMLKTGTEPVTEGLDKINQTPIIGDLY